jgi:hypothetical protein
MSIWTSDDLFLEAAYTSGMTLPDTAKLLRKPEDEVRQKAVAEGFIESPAIVARADHGQQVEFGKATAEYHRG